MTRRPRTHLRRIMSRLPQNDLWGGDDAHAWFKADFTVPEEMDGKNVVLRLNTDSLGQYAATTQFLVFINREVVQGFDPNHNETPLSGCIKAGSAFRIDVQAYGGKSSRGRNAKPYSFELFAAEISSAVEKLYYDINVPFEVAKMLDKEDKKRIDIEQHLANAINMLDLRQPHSQAFNVSVENALRYLEDEFYAKYCGDESVVVSCVGHTHIDVAWLWDLAQTRQKVQRSFSTVLSLMSSTRITFSCPASRSFINT